MKQAQEKNRITFLALHTIKNISTMINSFATSLCA